MRSPSAPELLPGTLEMLILKTLMRGPEHGYGISRHLKLTSDEVLQVGEGSLYPALQRLLVNGLVTAEWKITSNNRRARYYKITAAGRKHMKSETALFNMLVQAIQRIMETA